jgi:hypothetical protein
MPPSWPIGAAPASWARIQGRTIDRTGEFYQLPLAIGDHHLQLAE